MKFFITGTSGFVGKNLLSFYKEHDIHSYTRGQNLVEELEKFQPDVIINSAAEIYDSEKMYASNIQIVYDCLEHVKKTKIRMIQIGSSSEYGIMNRASNETDRINPIDMYQATKGAATLLCQGYARKYKLDILIARPYSVYGPGEKSHRLFPKLYKAFVQNEPMTLNQGYHDFIYIDDFVRGIDILVRQENPEQGDIVNFGSGVQYSNFEICDIFEEILGHSAPINKVSSMAKSFENDVWVCDTTYAEEKYGFKIEYDIDSGIRKLLQIGIDWRLV